MQISVSAKSLFFDRKEVIEAVGRSRVKMLSKAGGLVRKSAKEILVFKPQVRKPRKVKNRQQQAANIEAYRAAKKASASPPGAVPFVRRRQYPNLTSVVYAYDPGSQSVVVGPIERRKRSMQRTAPDVHERGGTVRINVTGRDGKVRPMTANYPKRPLIGPAFSRVKNQMPSVMSNTIGPA